MNSKKLMFVSVSIVLYLYAIVSVALQVGEQVKEPTITWGTVYTGVVVLAMFWLLGFFVGKGE